jgi:dTDP-glucose pyrophosphorylase
MAPKEGKRIMPVLLIMAAGIGSRYGGLKQVDPVGPNGETIIDYSVFDAVRAGFRKVIFIIRPEFETLFREKVSSRYEAGIETLHAYQDLHDGLEGFIPPGERERPWGTGHAVLVTEKTVNEPFAVINADDFYGRSSLEKMAAYLANAPPPGAEEYAMVGYTLRNTLSEHGHVSRGVCRHDPELFLEKIVERTRILKEGAAACYLDQDDRRHPLTGDEIVSMNLWGFRPAFFTQLREAFRRFLGERGRELKAEFFIPTVVDRLIAEGRIRVKILPTEDAWFGVTYREDKEIASGRIRKLIDQGVYPEKIWP